MRLTPRLALQQYKATEDRMEDLLAETEHLRSHLLSTSPLLPGIRGWIQVSSESPTGDPALGAHLIPSQMSAEELCEPCKRDELDAIVKISVTRI